MASTSPKVVPIASPICGILSSLESLAVSSLSVLTSRLYALKQLANMLEHISVNFDLPDPTTLIPIKDINMDTYNRLAEACPGLLPIVDVTAMEEAAVAMLRQMVLDAYTSLFMSLLRHPLAQMAKLDSELSSLINRAVDDIQNALIPPIGIMECLSAFCRAANVVPTAPPELIQSVATSLQVALAKADATDVAVKASVTSGIIVGTETVGAVTFGVAGSTTGVATGSSAPLISVLSGSQQASVAKLKTLQNTLANLAGIVVRSPSGL